MAGGKRAVRKGDELRQKVVDLAQRLGLETRTEVPAARRLWGAKRRIDVVLIHPETGKTLGIECKYQGGRGSAEEKIPATVQDLHYWPIPGIVVIEGDGFSRNMEGFLMATGKVVWFEDLEDWLQLYFGL